MFRSRMPILLAEKEMRDKRRITQREIARETGLARATIGSWMSHEGMPRLDAGTVKALMDYFDCSIENLVTVESDEGQMVAVAAL
jgi:transcriptional regulator with XRE-family HTH domain